MFWNGMYSTYEIPVKLWFQVSHIKISKKDLVHELIVINIKFEIFKVPMY